MSKSAAVSDVNAALSLSLLTIVALAVGTFAYVVPRVAEDGHAGTKRLGWYLRSGQWRADARTLLAVGKYFVDEDANATGKLNGPGN